MEQSSRTTVGVVGVGTIASAVVEAMLAAAESPEIAVVLSPRSKARSAALAERHPVVRIADDNQAVVDAADIVLIGVLPQQVAETCAALRFREEQIVVGMPAGWPPSRLSAFVAPSSRVCQVVPLPMIELGAGPLVLYPRIPEVDRLLSGSGKLVVPEREADLITLNCASAVMSTFFAFEHAVTSWMAGQGVSAPLAKQYASELFSGLAAEAVATEGASIAPMIEEHETPGGLNEFLRTSLESAGVFADVGEHLDQMARRLGQRR